MTTRPIAGQRISLTSSKPFAKVIDAIEQVIGRPDMMRFGRAMAAAATLSEIEELVGKSVGDSGFMEFARHNLGEVLRKEQGPAARKSIRLLIGNPLIMKEMLKHVPDAGSYAPVTLLIDERADGVHLSYDKVASSLACYENPEATKVALDLDRKVEKLMTHAAFD